MRATHNILPSILTLSAPLITTEITCISHGWEEGRLARTIARSVKPPVNHASNKANHANENTRFIPLAVMN